MYLTQFTSPVGDYLIASDGEAITGIWKMGQKHFPADLARAHVRSDLPVFQQAKAWLQAYFFHTSLPPLPLLAPQGGVFQQAVWKLLREIPYGETTTYGALSHQLQARGIHACARSVGGAVSHNPISILIPCHRVLGVNRSLTGYAGGLKVKRFLLLLEGVNLSETHMSEVNQSESKNFRYLPEAEQTIPGMKALPQVSTDESYLLGKYPCPCCGCRTFPVPAGDAVAYICPVCMWENDVFIHSDDEPSDENHGLTLSQGQENYRVFHVCNPHLSQYARAPLPHEIPE